jgi:hypothetical protein
MCAVIAYGSSTAPTVASPWTLAASDAESSGSTNCVATAHNQQTTAASDGAVWTTPSTKAAQVVFAIYPSTAAGVSADASGSVTLTSSAVANVRTSGGASQAATVTQSATVNRAASLAASQAVTVTQSATALKAKPILASQAVTVTQTATANVATSINASQAITVTQSAAPLFVISTPGPLTNLSNANTPAALEALSLVRGGQIRHGLDVLDTTDTPTNETLRFTTGSVTWSYRLPDLLAGQTDDVTAVRRQGSLTVDGDVSINLLARRLRLWTEWRLLDGSWARWHLGVFETTVPKLDDDGTIVSRTLALADKSYRWSQTKLTDPVHLDDTQAAIPWVIADLGTRFGETRFAISGDATATVGGNGLTFDADTDLLTLYSKVLGSVGNDQLTTDADGTPSSQPLSVLAGKGPSAVYGPGARKIVPAGSVESLLPTLPNVVRFVARQGPSSGGSEGNGIYTVTNQSTGPGSIDVRGYEIPITVTVDAVDETTLESVAESEKQRYFAGGGNKFTGSIALNPTMGDRDVIAINLPRLGLTDSDTWQVTDWTYNLGAMTQSTDALMPITAEMRVP